jgi:hypothetical protein
MLCLNHDSASRVEREITGAVQPILATLRRMTAFIPGHQQAMLKTSNVSSQFSRIFFAFIFEYKKEIIYLG